jgi:GxxExxY protein
MTGDCKNTSEIAEGAEVTRSGQTSSVRENEITEKVIGAAIEVHRLLGPGLLESAYQECICYELSRAGLSFQRQVQVPVVYKGLKLDCGFKLDLLVEGAVIVELKATDDVLPIHKAQLLTYLKAANKRVGLLINFNVPVLKNGLKRMVNHHIEPERAAEDSASSAPSGVDVVLPSPRNLSALCVSAVKTHTLSAVKTDPQPTPTPRRPQ